MAVPRAVEASSRQAARVEEEAEALAAEKVVRVVGCSARVAKREAEANTLQAVAAAGVEAATAAGLAAAVAAATEAGEAVDCSLRVVPARGAAEARSELAIVMAGQATVARAAVAGIPRWAQAAPETAAAEAETARAEG